MSAAAGTSAPAGKCRASRECTGGQVCCGSAGNVCAPMASCLRIVCQTAADCHLGKGREKSICVDGSCEVGY